MRRTGDCFPLRHLLGVSNCVWNNANTLFGKPNRLTLKNSSSGKYIIRPVKNFLFAVFVILALFLEPTVVYAGNNFPGTTISGSSGSLTASNTTATSELSEPTTYGGGSVNSMWYSWTAPSSGTLTVQTCGGSTNFDTTLQTYSGSAVGSLSQLASNDDDCSVQSTNSLSVTSGTTYRIQVDGYGSDTGTFTLSWNFASIGPSADAFPGITISGTSGSASGSNTSASGEFGEPVPPGGGALNTIWYNWTAPSSGTFTVGTCSATSTNFDTTMGVYTGSAVNALTTQASNDDACANTTGSTASRVSFSVTSGTTYYIQVDGYTTDTGDYLLSWNHVPSVVTPPAPTGTQTCSALTGAWSGGSATSGGIAVTRSLSASGGGSWNGSATDFMNTISAFSAAAVQGNPSKVDAFNWTGPTSSSGDLGNYTLTFAKPVTNPVIHIDRVGGVAATGTSNSSKWTLTSGGTLVRLAGVGHFETYSDNTFLRVVGDTSSGTESSTNPATGTGAGSVMVSGTHSSVTFSVSGLEPGIAAGGDAFEVVACAPQADLSLAKSVNNSTPTVGTNVIYTVTLSNGGADAAPGVIVTDVLPAGLTFVSATPSQGSASNASGTVTWNAGTVAVGGTAPTLLIEATVTGTGAITNTAEVTASTYVDPDSDPNDGAGDDFASIPITAAASGIIANDDAYASPVNGSTGETGFMNVLSDNGSGADTLGGVDATAASVSVAAVGSPPTGVTLNSDGSIDVAASTSEGVKSFDYQICELPGGVNCDTATVVFTVIDLSDTGLPATAQTCTSPLATYAGGASGSLSAGSYSANYSTSVSSSGFGAATITGGSSLLVDIASNSGSNPDRYSVTYTLSTITSDTQVIRIYGGRGLPGGGTTGDNAAGSYTFTWTGGAGNASYYDPAAPSSGMYRFTVPSGFDLNQSQIFGTSSSGGISNGGTINTFDLNNASNEWYVDLPAGATSVTIEKSVFNQGLPTGQGIDYSLPVLGSSSPGESFREWVTISTLLCESVDFSDAPTAGYGGAKHTIISGTHLGSAVTSELADYNHPTANGDVDDGVTLPSMTQGDTVTIPVVVAGAGGYLQAWIDWDGDGSFGGASEQIASDVQDGGAGDVDAVADGTVSLSVAVPITAITTQTFARFRWSTTSGLGTTDAAKDGEVEDYSLIVSAAVSSIVVTKNGSATVLSGALSGVTDVGDTAVFAITIENTGATTLTGVAIASDTLTRIGGGALTLTSGPSFVSNSGASPAGTLVSGEIATFSATYEFQQADIDAGGVSNTATATGTPPSGPAVTDISDDPADATDTDTEGDGEPDDPTVVTIPGAPSLTVVKSFVLTKGGGNTGTDAEVGDTIVYTYVVTNNGNQTMSNIEIDDSGHTGLGTWVDPAHSATITTDNGTTGDSPDGNGDTTIWGTLAPLDIINFTSSYVVTQADMDAQP